MSKKSNKKPEAQQQLPVGNGLKVVDIQGQKVQAFESLNFASQAASRIVQLLQQFSKTVPLGDGVSLFADIQEGIKLVNNTLALAADAELKIENTKPQATPVGQNDLVKD